MQSETSSSNLAQQVKNKDKKAFEKLYDDYSAALYGGILRIVKNEAVAEEVAQDTFLKIWDKIDSYDESKGKLFTWMFKIARNLAIDKIRSKEIKQSNKSDELQDTVYASGGFTSQREDDIGVKPLISALREEERMIIDLVYFQGYTHSEIADEKGIPIGTVKTRLRMALINLRKILGKT
jgi:RNA polymerase sigma-70 factor (ECF subfamily)